MDVVGEEKGRGEVNGVESGSLLQEGDSCKRVAAKLEDRDSRDVNRRVWVGGRE